MQAGGFKTSKSLAILPQIILPHECETARIMVHDRQRSEDLFQDVFLTVWRKRAQYHFPRPFKPWLYAIAVNRVRQVGRRRDRIESFPENGATLIEPPVAGASPFASAIATETSALVQEAVALLSPKRQLVVTMRIWSDFSYAEIADALGVSEGTVRSNMRDALIAIRRYLEPRM
jgi:RNA polymerase sigma-70 factor, ECF subfamily